MTTTDRRDADDATFDRVAVSLPADDVAFLRGFDPDRDRTASRADMVRVIEHLQAALADQPAPGTDSSGRDVQRVLVLADELDSDAERAYQRSCGHRDEGSDGQYRAYEDAAARIRAAVAGPQRDHDEEGGQ